MLHATKNLTKSFVCKPEFAFAGLFSKRKPTSKELDKYDVLWVGANLGGITSRHFDDVVHGKYSMMAIFD